MSQSPVIAIFDIGKTNKKIFLFNEDYEIVFEQSVQLEETLDEDGDVCEDINELRSFVIDSMNEVLNQKNFTVKAVNYSAYGASFVYLDKEDKELGPLYNYLKTYPDHLHKQFYNNYGGEAEFSVNTASPVLGNLNSGLQIYRLKYVKPERFEKIKKVLHLPQYISWLLSKQAVSEITSIGCHTALWDFNRNEYHSWVFNEGVAEKLPDIFPSDAILNAKWKDKELLSGVGLHDSSAALIPYLANFQEPFVLISTGTWCISLNPFNDLPLTVEELNQDCLCYLTYKGKPVKASRLFAGNEHEQQVKKMAEHFKVPIHFYKEVEYDPAIATRFEADIDKAGGFDKMELSEFENYAVAYHFFMTKIIRQQYISTQLVMKGVKVQRIFVDGGFSQNPVYMNMLALSFPGIEIYAASMAQASALGAALAIHSAWNSKPIRNDLIQLKYYSDQREIINY